MNQVSVDAETPARAGRRRRAARRDLDAAAQAHGLAVPGGHDQPHRRRRPHPRRRHGLADPPARPARSTTSSPPRSSSPDGASCGSTPSEQPGPVLGDPRRRRQLRRRHRVRVRAARGRADGAVRAVLLGARPGRRRAAADARRRPRRCPVDGQRHAGRRTERAAGSVRARPSITSHTGLRAAARRLRRPGRA